MIGSLLLLLGGADAATTFTVPADWHLIEGIASDGRRIWVSSVVDRALLEVDGKSGLRPIRLPQVMGAPFGIAWDDKRKWLWVAAMCPTEPAIPNCGASGLFAIDPSGHVRRSLTVEGAFSPGDVSVDGARGRVFVSDGLNGAVYSCEGECTALKPVTRPTERASAQGSAATPDGKALVVADYSRGIMLVDLATGAETMIKTADGKRLRGVDGLVRRGRTYVAVANASMPAQLIEFEIGDDGALVNPRVSEDVPELGDATQIANAGERLLLVGDAQWRHYIGKEPAGPKAQGPTPIHVIPPVRGN